MRPHLARYRGREVKTLGDGFLATFDGPGRAIRCASEVRDAVRPLGLEVRAGLHTGEVEVAGDDISGIAVNIGARVGAKAEPGRGARLPDGQGPRGRLGRRSSSDRGEHDLKGVPGPWRLWAVDSA